MREKELSVVSRIACVASGFAVVSLLALVLISCTGCNQSKQRIEAANQRIHQDASHIDATAGSVRRNLDAIVKTHPAPPAEPTRDAREGLDSIQRAANSILGQSSSIQSALPGVQNTPSGFLATIKTFFLWGTIVVGALLGLYLLAVTGLLPWAASALAWLVRKIPALILLIPRAVRANAKLESEALALAPQATTLRESVAISRATDPLYDAAFTLERRAKDAGR